VDIIHFLKAHDAWVSRQDFISFHLNFFSSADLVALQYTIGCVWHWMGSVISLPRYLGQIEFAPLVEELRLLLLGGRRRLIQVH